MDDELSTNRAMVRLLARDATVEQLDAAIRALIPEDLNVAERRTAVSRSLTHRTQVQLPLSSSIISKASIHDSMTARKEYLALVVKWNRHVDLFNNAIRRRSGGRPLGADEALVKEVRELQEDGNSLRGIALITEPPLSTVRTIIDRDNGSDRTTKNPWQRVHPGEKWEERARSRGCGRASRYEVISDLIADLLHLARRDNYSLSRCLELAEHGIGMFIAENRAREGEPMANDRSGSSSERALCTRDIADRRSGGKTIMRLIEQKVSGASSKKINGLSLAAH